MKVTVREEPAWKRVLEIEIEPDVVSEELDRVVEEYRRRLVLPGFRKGKVPVEIARRHLGEDVEEEVLRRLLPDAIDTALRDHALKPLGDPRVSNLHFKSGEPLAFTAVVEVMPEVQVGGYEGLTLTREQQEVTEEDLQKVLDELRDRNADLEDVDRPAHKGDVVVIRYLELSALGNLPEGEEPTELSLELGSPRTPEVFNKELDGAVLGDMKRIPLTYPPDYPDDKLAGSTRNFHVTVAKVQEKVWLPLDDAFARKVLGSEDAKLDDLKSRIRLNLEAEARMHSMQHLENKLVHRLLELNPFDLPEGVVDGAVARVLEKVREENPTLGPDEEQKVREHYKDQIGRHYKVDILMDSVARQEGIEVTDEDLDKELESFAQQESQNPAQVKARLKKEGSLERLRDDLFRRRVLDRLVEKAAVTVAVVGHHPGEE